MYNQVNTTQTATPNSQLAAILLAAGESTRMGEENKLLLPVFSEPMVRRSSRALLALANRTAVLGHDADEVRMALDGFDFQIVVNPNYRQGMLTSLQAAISQFSADVQGALICLGDQPFLSQRQIERAADYFSKTEDPSHHLFISEYSDERGHPTIIGREYFAEILARTEEPMRGAQFLFHKYPERIHTIQMSDEDICIDIDTPEDYLKAVQL